MNSYVNLLPDNYLREKQNRARSEKFTLGFIFILIISMALIFWIWNDFIEIKNIVAIYESLKSKNLAFSDQLTNLQNDITAVEERIVQQGGYTHTLPWREVLADLERVLPERVRVQNLTIDAHQIQLSIKSPSASDLEIFLKNLNDTQQLAQIENQEQPLSRDAQGLFSLSLEKPFNVGQ